MRACRCWVVAGIVVAGCGLAAVAAVAAPPYAYGVRVHSWRADGRALTEGYCWTHRQPLGTFRPPPPDTRCLNIDWKPHLPVRYLPIRAGAHIVVRVREPARSVALRLVDADGRRLARRRARALGSRGLVWRVRVPRGVDTARVAVVGVRYRNTADIAPVGVVLYEISACPHESCAQPAEGRIA